ncbi:MAG: translation initiation factor 1A [Candidatus Lokiarchaeota archaeon]|nr:translation initiation factor 1A [Candidatus Lokiarchaeota archaeon]
MGKKDKKKNSKGRNSNSEAEFVVRRIRTPSPNEVLGIVLANSGGGWMKVQCLDQKVRNCRIRGKIRKRQWIRIDDWVLVEPWQDMQSDERGDIIMRYNKSQARWLEKNGYIVRDDITIT